MAKLAYLKYPSAARLTVMTAARTQRASGCSRRRSTANAPSQLNAIEASITIIH